MTSPVKQHPASPDTKVPAQSFTANYLHTKYKPKQKDSKEKESDERRAKRAIPPVISREEERGGVLRLEVTGERSVLT